MGDSTSRKVSADSMHRITLETVDSTNLEAKRLFENGGIAGPAVVTAREQTAGRGSRGRSWMSPRDMGVYMSVVDVPAGPVTVAEIEPTLFTLAAGIACVDVLRTQAGVDVRIKPVNDLYVEGRKLGGILTETMVAQHAVRAVVTGVGINVRSAHRTVAAGAAEPIALQDLMAAHSFGHLSFESLIASLAQTILETNRLVWNRHNERLRDLWRSHLVAEDAAGPELC